MCQQSYCLASFARMNEMRYKERQRLCDLLFAYVHEEDKHLSDEALVQTVAARYKSGIKGNLVDPNE